jgi:anti-sigma regulatory factor (Ser/Thr protein kinase)
MNDRDVHAIRWAKAYELATDLDAVSPVCDEVKRALLRYGREGYGFAILILLREAFANAVRHGNRHDRRKMVSCRITLTDEHVVIEVADQGMGFDWQNALEKVTAGVIDSGITLAEASKEPPTIQAQQERRRNGAAQSPIYLPSLKECGRGLSIYSHYAEQIRFNERGNEVTLVVNCGQ